MQKLTHFPITAIVKPTKNCNLNCKYCYENRNCTYMDDETLKRVISEVINYNTTICKRYAFDKTISDFIWHGGEPLLMGIPFFKKVEKLQNEYAEKGHIVNNSIQSNLTLLTPDMWDYFKTSGFRLGSSLDGNQETNDKTRVFKNGRGSFKRIMQSIDITRKDKSTRSPIGFILVLTKDKLHEVKDIYKFFKENNISFDVNFPSIAGNAKGAKESIEVTPEEWANAMNELFSLWYYDQTEPFIDIPFLSKFSTGLLSGRINSCTFGGTCRNRYISIDPSGDVYPCGKFGPHDEFKLGNIRDQSIFEILDSEINKHLLTRSVDNIESCKECEYKNICNAGCFYNAYAMSGDPLAKDPLCNAYKILFKHMGGTLKKEFEELGKNISIGS